MSKKTYNSYSTITNTKKGKGESETVTISRTEYDALKAKDIALGLILKYDGYEKSPVARAVAAYFGTLDLFHAVRRPEEAPK